MSGGSFTECLSFSFINTDRLRYSIIESHLKDRTMSVAITSDAKPYEAVRSACEAV
jgi:hypothetical protein